MLPNNKKFFNSIYNYIANLLAKLNEISLKSFRKGIKPF